MSSLGFLLVDKDIGLPSNHLDSHIKRLFNIKRVGHLGTLDPFASGLMIIAIGEMTKALPLFKDEKKEYIATLKLGSETDTLDKLGKVISTKPIKDFDEKKIQEVFEVLKKRGFQYPPKYSAKWIEGKRAYQLALEGKEFELKKIKIKIYSLKLLKYDKDSITFKTLVSKGTYIRSLAYDIANLLGTTGHLDSLRRTKIDNFDISMSTKEKDLTDASIFDERIIPDSITIYPDDEIISKVIHGHKVKLDYLQKYLFIKKQDKYLAIYIKDGEYYRSFRGFAIDNQPKELK